MGPGRRMRAALAALGSLALAQAALAAGCVDGVTPNCSDPAARCEPSTDAPFDRAEVAPDAADTGTDTSVDALPDALADADLDAGDEI